jgi:hypothetical protein
VAYAGMWTHGGTLSMAVICRGEFIWVLQREDIRDVLDHNQHDDARGWITDVIKS